MVDGYYLERTCTCDSAVSCRLMQASFQSMPLPSSGSLEIQRNQRQMDSRWRCTSSSGSAPASAAAFRLLGYKHGSTDFCIPCLWSLSQSAFRISGGPTLLAHPGAVQRPSPKVEHPKFQNPRAKFGPQNAAFWTTIIHVVDLHAASRFLLGSRV